MIIGLSLLSICAALLAQFSPLAALLLLPAVALAGKKSIFEEVNGLTRWLILGWLIWLPFSLFFSQAPGLSLSHVGVLLGLPVAWLVGIELRSRGNLDALFDISLPVLLLVLLFWGIIQGPNTYTLKPQGPFNDPNTFVGMLNLLMLPFLARYLATDLARSTSWLRTGQLAVLATVAFVAFLVSSRGATVALLLVLPAMLWLARNQLQFGRKLILLISVSMVSYLSALSVSSGLSLAQRLVATVQEGDPIRIMLMKSAWLMIMDHPWVGSGFGTFRLFYSQYRFPTETISASGWVHNDYLQIWLESGLPMFLLVLGLVLWVLWVSWRTLLEGGREALLRMGYLAGIVVILLHALVNYFFFFAMVSLLVGFYLARVSDTNTVKQIGAGNISNAKKNMRARTLAAGGYVFLMGYLLIGQVAVEGLLGNAHFIQRSLSYWSISSNIVYPRYEVAYWVSVLAPFHPAPHHVMGLELSDGFDFDPSREDAMRKEALVRMASGRQRAPCYMPYANDVMAIINPGNATSPPNDALRSQGRAIISHNMKCNARHGLSYYHAGSLANSDSEAMMWWQAGLASSYIFSDRLLLATAILSKTMPGKSEELISLSAQMARAIRIMESNPDVQVDQLLWTELQYKLLNIAGPNIFKWLDSLAKP